jgi:hypothetical protein
MPSRGVSQAFGMALWGCVDGWPVRDRESDTEVASFHGRLRQSMSVRIGFSLRTPGQMSMAATSMGREILEEA